MIASFSGAHPYRPQCLISQIDQSDRDDVVAFVGVITTRIDNGHCPRCDDPLPTPPERPAGSRITSCRCVPICGPCGTHEGLPMSLLYQADQEEDDEEEYGWLLDPGQRDADLAAFRERYGVDIISGAISDGVLVTDDGTVRPVKLRPHPGGWAEHGYDDTSDTAERQR